MPTNIPTATLDRALDGAVASYGTHVSLHTGNPGTTGASELTGGSPAYARKAVTWGSSSGAVKTGGAVTFDVGAGKTISWYGIWTASTGGTFVGGGPLRNAGNSANISESYTEQGQYVLTPKLTADDLVLT